ncbi:glycoside hydrolase family 97 protein [Proteiniphilum sp.]|uniref:glycoside hydrolase family 97 protein n=1 Tax=Proteiniphilum sp. TaxID=1926877 RepID=UPI0033312080
MHRIFLLFVCCFIFISLVNAQKQFGLKSPDTKIEIQLTIGNTIEYSIVHQGDLILDKSPISITLTDGRMYGVNSKLFKYSNNSVGQTIQTSIYKKKKIIDQYNELTLHFKDGFNLIFRAYNDGVAYRFISTSKEPFEVKNEEVIYNFPSNQKIYASYVKKQRNSLQEQFFSSFENLYSYFSISDWDPKRIAFLPVLVEGVNNKKVCILEADLMNYPGMYLYKGETKNSLKAVFAPYPDKVSQGGHNNLQILVETVQPYIAKYDKGTSFPWRALVISTNDHELADNDMVYKLASPAKKETDFAWVKPGKVAWEWWNDWNLNNVDFKTGVNNETYQYYIDFASKYGVEYVILDEGWAVNQQADLFQVVPEIDLEALVAYANEKNIGLILWAGYHAFDRDMERVCKHYSEMGIKGFKIDFMDRDDQLMVNFHYRAAKTAAKYKMMLDFHGTYKPTGLQRTFPNVINFEGVHGLETMKWSTAETDQVTYDVTIPFIRMVAGPMDYTQGAMRNATRKNYYPVYSEAMSQGTRCRQLAQYVIFESPLNMLCDSPSNYMAEPECVEFITSIPTIWDKTVAMNGEVAKYISIARKKGDIWYIGSLTNWDARSLNLDLSFLGEGNFKAEIFRDGINADRLAKDYKREIINIPDNRQLPIYMASGGGIAIKVFNH